MSSLRVRLFSLWILLAVAMAAIMFIAVERFSSPLVLREWNRLSPEICP